MLNIPEFFKRPTFSQEKKVLLENFLALSFLQVINYLLPLISFPYLVWVLGPEKFGLISFAQAFIQYFVLLTDYGFNLSATREISIYRNDKGKVSDIFSSVMIIKIILLALSFVLASILIYMIPKFANDWILYLFTFGMVFGNVLFPTWFFQGMERMKYITILNIVAKVIFTLSIFIFIKNPQHYVFVPLLNSCGYLSAGAISIWIIHKNFGIRFTMPGFNNIRYQWKEGWHVFISTIAISAYSNTRIFAVGLMTNNAITGFYSIAEKLINIIQSSCLIPLIQAVYPRLSKVYTTDPSRSFRITKKLQNYTVLAYAVFLPVIFIFAPQIIKVIARSAYPESVLSLRLLLIATFFVSANTFRAHFLLVAGQRNIC